MSLKTFLKPMVDENVRLITTDHDLQKFMLCVFPLLFATIWASSTYLGFVDVERYWNITESLLQGNLDTTVPPLVEYLFLGPRLISPDLQTYRIVFSVYGFAWYMLGGHFMLKLCRETESSQRRAYVILLIVFACLLNDLTCGYGGISVAFVIMAFWFFEIRNYPVCFAVMGLATMAEPHFVAVAIPMMLMSERVTGNLVIYLGTCLILSVPYIIAGSFEFLNAVQIVSVSAICLLISLLWKRPDDRFLKMTMVAILSSALYIAIEPSFEPTHLMWAFMLLPLCLMKLENRVLEHSLEAVFIIVAVISFASHFV